MVLVYKLGNFPFLRTNFNENDSQNWSFNPTHWSKLINRSTKPLKIAIWTSPELSAGAYRRHVVDTMVIQRQNKNYCFRENYYCAMTQNTFDIKEADAIVFFSFGNGFPR